MSSINTNKYRTFLAQQFRTTLLLGGADATVKADITSTNTALMSAGAATTSEFYLGVGREPTADFCQLGGKVFLKSSMTNSFCP